MFKNARFPVHDLCEHILSLLNRTSIISIYNNEFHAYKETLILLALMLLKIQFKKMKGGE